MRHAHSLAEGRAVPYEWYRDRHYVGGVCFALPTPARRSMRSLLKCEESSHLWISHTITKSEKDRNDIVYTVT